jgi:Flp pilus assembly protein TadD
MIELPGFLKRKSKPKVEKVPAPQDDLQKVWKAVSNGRQEDALGMVEKVIDQAKTNRDAWMAKGAILEMLKRPKDAQEAYEQAGSLGSKEGFRRAAQLRAEGNKPSAGR